MISQVLTIFICYNRNKRKEGFAINTIPFRVTGIKESYKEGREWLQVTEEDDIIKISICKEFTTPGNTLRVDRIVEENGIYYIYLFIAPPSKNTILLQVVTYMIVNIEINKRYIKSPRYEFRVKSSIPPTRIRSMSIKEW